MRLLRSTVATAVAFALVTLASCGGGGADTAPRANITSLRAMGDSLADSGTFGYKFTVQGSDSLVYPERVAQTYGLALCNHYTATSATTFVVNPTNPACTDYAVGGGRINNYTAPTSPVSIVQQLKDAAAAGGFGADELVLIDGGANDAADLVGAFLAISTDGGASYSALLGTVLPAATVATALAGGATGAASIGSTYFTTLADNFASAITTSVLGNGAQRVAVLNIPSIVNTPRLQSALTNVSAASGGGSAGAAASAQAAAVFNGWLSAFNTELAAKFAGNPNVVIVDFYTAFNDEIASPANYSLTNVTTPACPQTGVSDGLPTYTFPTCTAASLSATTPPAGSTGGSDWWKSYAFSDSFHPTPFGHDLLARYISRALASAGWL